MPNWCHNTLQVSGEPQHLQGFLDAVADPEQNTPLCFDSLVPQPPDLHERVELGLEGLINTELPDIRLDWYSWRVRHWGTKWEPNFGHGVAVALLTEAAVEAGEPPADGAGLILLPGQAHFSFLTAWSPPTPWVQTASKLYPQLEFQLTWAEPGNDFAGRLQLQAGHGGETELQVEDVLAPQDRWF